MTLFSLMGRRQAARTAVVLCAALTGYAAMAQNFPARSIRLVVAQAPGSSADALARSVATKMAESFKSAVVVDNKPGANGNLGMDLVAKAAPDGYTLGLAVPSVMTVNPYVYKNMPFKPLEDLVGVTQTTSIIFGLHINPKLPVKSVAELVAYAKRQPNGLNYSSAGVGNLGHLAGELFAAQAGIKMTHIPNKGDTPGLLDVMGGQTDLMFAPVPSAISYVRGGRLTLLAVASRKRSAAFPRCPRSSRPGCRRWWSRAGPASSFQPLRPLQSSPSCSAQSMPAWPIPASAPRSSSKALRSSAPIPATSPSS